MGKIFFAKFCEVLRIGLIGVAAHRHASLESPLAPLVHVIPLSSPAFVSSLQQDSFSMF